MRKLLSIILFLAILAGCALYFFPDRLPQELLPASGWFRHRVDETVETIRKRIWPEPEAEQGQDAQSFDVIRVIDGDTILVSVFGSETTVRLIGIDAPESVHWDAEKNTPEGEEASRFLKQYLDGKKVTLEYDQELKDRYDRTLAYVYSDGILVQDTLLAMGMARTLTMEPNTRYQHHFELLERQAREGGAGFWGTGFYER